MIPLAASHAVDSWFSPEGLMGIRTWVATVATALVIGSSADAAVLWTFDGTVEDARLKCEDLGANQEGCDAPAEGGSFAYDIGDTGIAAIRIRKGSVSLRFLNDLIYEGEATDRGIYGYFSLTSYSDYDQASLSWDDLSGGFNYANDDYPYYETFFLSLENGRLSPVPLPASAALLPLGLGALALLRRRRRSA